MTQKDENDWSEDEQKLAKEFEKRVKELQEEREKYRKVFTVFQLINFVVFTILISRPRSLGFNAHIWVYSVLQSFHIHIYTCICKQ
jgi:uncharacterized membrane protein (DUF485 family)